MTRLTRILALACTLLLTAAPVPRQEPFFFFQIADTQFGMFTKDADFTRETANFTKVIDAANRLRPAFVIVCGDLVNKVGDAAQIAEYRRIIARLDRSIPLYSVAGNHDVENTPTPASLAAYRRNIGPDQYVFRQGNVMGVVLNSSFLKDPSGAPDEAAKQLGWLKGALRGALGAATPPSRIFVFQHHSFFLEKSDEADQYFNIPRVRRDDFLALLQEHKVSHVFAGHYHRNAFGKDGEMEMVTTGPVGMPLGSDPSGIRVVWVDGRGVRHRYMSIDSIRITP